jgi:hypothetical protein
MKLSLNLNNLKLKDNDLKSQSFRLVEPIESKKILNLSTVITKSESMKDLIHSDRPSIKNKS